MSAGKPFQLRITTPAGNCTDATSVWLRDGRRLRVETTTVASMRYSASSERPAYTVARGLHFVDGRWEEVLPWHAVPYIADATDTEAAHAVVADRVVEFLAA